MIASRDQRVRQENGQRELSTIKTGIIIKQLILMRFALVLFFIVQS